MIWIYNRCGAPIATNEDRDSSHAVKAGRAVGFQYLNGLGEQVSAVGARRSCSEPYVRMDFDMAELHRHFVEVEIEPLYPPLSAPPRETLSALLPNTEQNLRSTLTSVSATRSPNMTVSWRRSASSCRLARPPRGSTLLPNEPKRSRDLRSRARSGSVSGRRTPSGGLP
jgi:hypothetical protein